MPNKSTGDRRCGLRGSAFSHDTRVRGQIVLLQMQSKNKPREWDEKVDWGLGGTDEWMYLYQDDLEEFSESGQYPRGTLLFRIWNPQDQGLHPLRRTRSISTGQIGHSYVR